MAEGNGTGTVGVAPDCALVAVRFPLSMSDAHFVVMFQKISSLADIVSCSWGFGPADAAMSTTLRDTIATLTRTGGPARQGFDHLCGRRQQQLPGAGLDEHAALPNLVTSPEACAATVARSTAGSLPTQMSSRSAPAPRARRGQPTPPGDGRFASVLLPTTGTISVRSRLSDLALPRLIMKDSASTPISRRTRGLPSWRHVECHPHGCWRLCAGPVGEPCTDCRTSQTTTPADGRQGAVARNGHACQRAGQFRQCRVQPLVRLWQGQRVSRRSGG